MGIIVGGSMEDVYAWELKYDSGFKECVEEHMKEGMTKLQACERAYQIKKEWAKPEEWIRLR